MFFTREIYFQAEALHLTFKEKDETQPLLFNFLHRAGETLKISFANI